MVNGGQATTIHFMPPLLDFKVLKNVTRLFVDVIDLRILRQGHYPGLSKQCLKAITKVLSK